MQKFLIKTKHLGLRFIAQEDIKFLEELEQDPVVKEFFPSGTLDHEEIQEVIQKCVTNCDIKNLPCFVIFTLDKNDFVGRAYFGELPSGEVKVGYLLHKEFWGKGYATEVLQSLLLWAKKEVDVDYLYAYADKENTASLRVMEKCGMTYHKDGVIKGMECHFYRIRIR